MTATKSAKITMFSATLGSTLLAVILGLGAPGTSRSGFSCVTA